MQDERSFFDGAMGRVSISLTRYTTIAGQERWLVCGPGAVSAYDGYGEARAEYERQVRQRVGESE